MYKSCKLCLSHSFLTETLCPHEYDIPLVRGGHLEGPHVFGFLICAFVSELWPQTWGTSIQGEMNNWNPWLMLKCYFTENCVSFKYFFFNMSTSIFHFKWVLPFPVKIHPFKIFTRATPGSSLVVNTGATKTQKNSLKLSTSEARSNYCSIVYYSKYEKTRFSPKKLKIFAQKLSPSEARCLP